MPAITYSSVRASLGTIMWRFWDNILLLQMGQSYVVRFRQFSKDNNVDAWRTDQQGEWDRISTVLALLATMHAAILALPKAPPFATAVWLGGAGLSVCGLFIVQYFPIRAFPISDADIRIVVVDGNQYINITLLAAAVASPVIITLWASLLFATGVVDYVIETDFGGGKYRVLAGVPLGFGFAAVLATLTIGETLGRRIAAQSHLAVKDTMLPQPASQSVESIHEA